MSKREVVIGCGWDVTAEASIGKDSKKLQLDDLFTLGVNLIGESGYVRILKYINDLGSGSTKVVYLTDAGRNIMMRNDVGIGFKTYSSLVHGLCKSGELEHACSFFGEKVLKGFIPRDGLYKMLVKNMIGKI